MNENPHLTATERELLSRTNQRLSDAERNRMRALIEKGDGEILAGAEWQELTALTDRLELLHADRLAALAELARLRGVTLDEVMSQVGIRFPDQD